MQSDGDSRAIDGGGGHEREERDGGSNKSDGQHRRRSEDDGGIWVYGKKGMGVKKESAAEEPGRPCRLFEDLEEADFVSTRTRGRQLRESDQSESKPCEKARGQLRERRGRAVSSLVSKT